MSSTKIAIAVAGESAAMRATASAPPSAKSMGPASSVSHTTPTRRVRPAVSAYRR